MRILEKKEPEIECTCYHCKSRLAVHKNDIKYWSSNDYDGGLSCVYRAKCMVCDSYFNIETSKIPSGWRKG